MVAERLPDADVASRLRKPWTLPEFWIVVILLGLQVTLIWAHPRIPTADGSAHKYSAWVFAQLQENESSELARFFTKRDDWLFPNAAYSWLLVRASRWLTLDQAEKLACSLYILALALSFRFFFVSLGGRTWVSQVLLLTVTLNFLFFMGFLSFLCGLPFALIAMGLTCRMLVRPVWPLAVLSNLSLLMAFWSHQLSFSLGLVSVVVLTVTSGRQRLLAGCSGWLPAAIGVAVYSSSFGAVLSGWQYRDTFWERLWRIASLRVATSFGGVEIRLAAALGLLVLLVALIVTTRRLVAGSFLPVATLGLVLLVLAVVTPRGAGSGFFIDDRIALFFWVVTFAVAGFADGKLGRALTVVAVIFCVAQMVMLTREFRQFNDEYSAFAAAADQIPSGAEAFAYSFLDEDQPGVVQPFANPNPRLALATKSPSYYHYQADPRHCANFLICYTDEGLSRYVGERTFAGIHPSNLIGFVDHVMIWGNERRAEGAFRGLYGFERELENAYLRIYGSLEIPLEKELAELRRAPDPHRRRELAQRIVAGRGVDRRVVEPDRLVIANAHQDGWTRGTRVAAVVVINRESEPWVPILKIRGPPERNNIPMTVFVEDGVATEAYPFAGRSQKITLSPVAAGSMRLFAVWTDRGWCLEKGYAPRRLGARLVKVLE